MRRLLIVFLAAFTILTTVSAQFDARPTLTEPLLLEHNQSSPAPGSDYSICSFAHAEL